jgi:hypothetical protein
MLSGARIGIAAEASVAYFAALEHLSIGPYFGVIALPALDPGSDLAIR